MQLKSTPDYVTIQKDDLCLNCINRRIKTNPRPLLQCNVHIHIQTEDQSPGKQLVIFIGLMYDTVSTGMSNWRGFT